MAGHERTIQHPDHEGTIRHLDHKRTIQHHMDFLVQSISMHNTLLGEVLVRKDVLSRDDLEYIKQKFPAERDQNREILKTVSKGSQLTYESFLDALRETKQQHIVDALLTCPECCKAIQHETVVPASSRTDSTPGNSSFTSTGVSVQEDKPPMSEEQKFLLEHGKAYMEANLDLEGTQLLLQLENQGIISQYEREKIERHSGQSKQVKALIERLLRKTGWHYNKFCDVVVDSAQKHIYDLCLDTKATLRKLQGKLFKYFLESYSEIDMLCLHDEGHQVRLEKIYVPLKWVTYQKKGVQTETKPLKDYTEIFQEDTEGATRRISIRGEPMAGKTTFLRKIAYDWAKVMSEEEKGSVYPETCVRERLKKLELVIPIILRLVKKNSEMENILEHQLNFLEEDDRAMVELMLSKQASKVVLIFDGLDEYDLDCAKAITDIMKGIKFPNCYCIITGRGEAFGKIKDWKHKIHVDAELQGFSRKHIIEYVNLYFNNAEDIGKGLLHKILPPKDACRNKSEKTLEETYELYGMAKNPGRLGILCSVWFEKREISTDRHTLYQDFIMLLLHLAEEKLNIQRSDKEEILDKHHDILMKFGALAMKRNIKTRVTVFSMKEVISTVGPDCMKYGFLYKSHPVSRLESCEVSFIHATVQEWLAAYYVAKKPDAVSGLPYDSLDTMFADKSFQMFLQKFDEGVLAKILGRMTCHDESSRHRASQLAGKILTWCCDLKLKPSVLNAIKGSKFSNVITELNVPGENLTGRGVALGRLLLQLPNLTQLDISQCQLKAGDLECLNHETKDHSLPIATLYLSRSTLSGCGAALGRLLPRLPKLTHLDVELCFMKADDFKQLTQETKNRTLQITQLMLSGNELPGCGAALGQLLLQLPRLTCLDVSSCQLTAGDLEHLTQKTRDNTLQIFELKLSCNELTGCGTALGRLLLQMPNLVCLDVSMCRLTADDLKQLTQETRNHTLQMQVFKLSCNNLTDGEAALRRLLAAMPNCTQCDLMLTRLTSENIRDYQPSNYRTTGDNRFCVIS